MFASKITPIFLLIMLSALSGFGQRQVSVSDEGARMQIATYTLPYGWKVDHKIAIDQQNFSRFFHYYKFDFHGPNQEVIRNVAPVQYSPLTGSSRDQALMTTLSQQMGALGNFRWGQWTAGQSAYYLFPQLAYVKGLQVYEIPLSGTRNGKAFQGVFIAMISDGGYGGSFNGLIVLSPQNRLQQTLGSARQIFASKRENSRYSQLFQAKRQRMQTAHQQEMARRQGEYDAHQKQMQGLYDARSRDNHAFNDYIKSRGQGNGGNANGPYTSQDGFNDHLKGTTSFDDTYFGHRISVQGNYQYWYTDGFGHYHGTNDAGFDPNSLQGHWYCTNPVR